MFKKLTKMIIISVIITMFYLLYTNLNLENPAAGWVTDKIALQGFRFGIVTNGKQPSNVTISSIQSQGLTNRYVKPSETIRFEASVIIGDDDPTPTFVFLDVMQGKSSKSRTNMLPDKRHGNLLLFMQEIPAPQQPGDYDVVVEVQYFIYDNTKGNIVQLPPYYKSRKGFTFHVKK